MKVNDLIKSVKVCLTEEFSCSECVFYECDKGKSCRALLAKAVENKFNELINLLDDKVNHHYYDTLEHYQEENTELRTKLDKILNIVKE